MTESHRHANNIVLLLQPERDDRDMYAEFLRYEGFTPLPLSMANDGLRVASRVAVVVSEILLPGPMDGVEFVTRLKDDERTRHTPAIVLTACAWNTERERAIAAGCDLFLPKPCLPDVLVTHIRRLLALGCVPAPAAARATLAARLRERRRS
jgi:CheY-like chemotaxis protein